MQTVIFLLAMLLAPVLSPDYAVAQVSPPARIGGTVTLDGTLLTPDTVNAIIVEVRREDGASYEPQAIDSDGLATGSNWYLLDIPIYHSPGQEGGARPGETGVLHVVIDGQEVSVTSPAGGTVTVGESGTNTAVNITAETGSPENQPPVANAGGDQTVSAGDLVQLDGSGSTDPEGSALSYQWTQTGGTAVSLSGATGVTAGFSAPTPAGDQTLELIFSLEVTDSSGASDADTITVWVTEEVTTYPPIADAGPDMQVTVGETVTLDGSNSTDPDSTANGITAYSWRQIDGATVSLANAGTARPSFQAPATGDSIVLTFELTVTDGSGETATDIVIVNISNTQNAPVADAGEDQLILSGQQVTLDGSGSADADGSITSWSWDQLAGPLVNLSDPLAVSPSFFAPQVGASGESLRFELTVTDNGGLRHSDTVTVNVVASTGSGTPPVADAGEDLIVTEGSQVRLNGEGSYDPDGEIRMQVWSQTAGPPVALSDARLFSPEFTAPDVGAEGATLIFELTVFDDGAFQDDDQVQVTVQYQGNRPIADAGNDLVVDPGVMVQLSAAASSDADGWITGYAWRQTGGIPVSLTRPDAMEPGFVAPWVGTEPTALTFRVTIRDNDGLTSEDEVVVTVNGGVAAPPVADAGSDREVYEGDTTLLNGSKSYAQGAPIVSYLWEQLEGPSVTIPDPWAAKTSVYIPPVDGDTHILFRLTVMSADGMKSMDQVRYTVRNYASGPGDDGGGGCFIQTLMK